MYLHALDVNWDTVDSPCDVRVDADLQIKVAYEELSTLDRQT